MNKETVTIVHIYKTAVWIEDDMFGARHVVIQHETCEPFTYCTFNYNYGYTSNSQTHSDAHEMALRLGAEEPVEHRMRAIKKPTNDEIFQEIEALHSMMKED